VVGRILSLTEGDFQVEEGDRLRVCQRRFAERTEETSSREIDLLLGNLQRLKL
jgi:hypothetical protein